MDSPKKSESSVEPLPELKKSTPACTNVLKHAVVFPQATIFLPLKIAQGRFLASMIHACDLPTWQIVTISSTDTIASSTRWNQVHEPILVPINPVKFVSPKIKIQERIRRIRGDVVFHQNLVLPDMRIFIDIAAANHPRPHIPEIH